MTNEAVPVEGPYETHDFTISGVTAITKGALMVLSDPRTAVASGVADDGVVFAGIAATDKTLDSNATEHGLHTTGTFLLKAANANIPVGSLVTISGVNIIRSITLAEGISGMIVGKALETLAANTTGEVRVGAII